MYLFRFDRLFPLILVAGMLQYGLVAIDGIIQGDAITWQLPLHLEESSGWLRYVKDGFLLVFGIFWPMNLRVLQLPDNVHAFVRAYFAWLLIVIGSGLIGFMLDYSPSIFLLSGIRWLMLLHAAVGVFLASKSITDYSLSHALFFVVLVVLGLLDAYVVATQLAIVSAAEMGGFGDARLLGVFNNAGVAGNFSLGLALFGMLADRVPRTYRLSFFALALFLAISSGSRAIAVAMFLIVYLQIWEPGEQRIRGSTLGAIRPLVLITLGLIATFYGYEALINVVGRGDILENQIGVGGRIGNALLMLSRLYDSDVGELLWGRGLGVGTNTAQSLLLLEGLDPEAYRFNWGVDNTFFTIFFQFGLVGSLIFWFGIYKFSALVHPVHSVVFIRRYKLLVLITCLLFVAGYPFEQYFFMLPLAAAFGSTFWKDWSTGLPSRFVVAENRAAESGIAERRWG